MKIKWIVLAVIVIGGFFYYKKQTSWREIVSAEGKFSISMPGQPTLSTKKIVTALGPIDQPDLILEQYGRAYGASCVEFPDKLITAENTDNVLNDGRDSAVANVQGKLISETNISFSGNPGRELKIEAKQGKVVALSRIYVINKKRLCGLIVVVPADSSIEKDATRFFNSFKPH